MKFICGEANKLFLVYHWIAQERSPNCSMQAIASQTYSGLALLDLWW
ncbi:MAG: hypothetical protein ACM65M_13565 [Microcoleus sp.]